MRVLIAGCGYVGCELARRLVADGDEVHGLRRSDGLLPEGVRRIRADLSDPASLAGLPGGLDAVVYAAAADSFNEAAYEAVYVNGLANLLGALRALGELPPRLLFVSSTGVYAQQNGEWVDEESPAEPTSFSGRLLLEGEHAARAAVREPVIVRLSGIYGPGRASLIDAVLAGGAPAAGETEGRQWTNRIHRDDAAGALRHLLRMARPEPLCLGSDCEPVSRGELLRWLAEGLGRPIVPGEAPTIRKYRTGRGNKRVRNARLLATGYTFAYPTYREGYSPLVAEQAGSRPK